MANDEFLPIKIVIPRDGDRVRQRASGGPRKVFGKVTRETRDSIADSVSHVFDYFSSSFNQWNNLPGVAIVSLKEKALAKSHRPTSLFTRTCPVIGVRGFGELLISVTPQGLSKLTDKVLEDDSDVNTANLSTLQYIRPYTQEDIILSEERANLLRFLEDHPRSLKIKLFSHGDKTIDSDIEDAFFEFISSFGSSAEIINYGEKLRLLKVDKYDKKSLDLLPQFLGVQNLDIFPKYDVLRTSSVPLERLNQSRFPAPETDKEYPTVGVIDSGTEQGDDLLSPWIVHRDNRIPEGLQDHYHGSFVCGLIANAKILNHNDSRFPASQSKIVDIGAISKDGINEIELVTILEEVIPQHPGIKIWNLSLGTGDPCQDQSFSDLAVRLDELQDQHNVIFIISAGNFNGPDLRGWPPDNLGESDRICPPSDSVRAITIGALAHTSNASSLVQPEQPSPFSRRGPGPVYIPKPELSHYGGNCDSTGNYAQTGILSLDYKKNLTENVGTSFSTPLVSTLLANIHHAADEELSSNLLRALIIHSSFLNSDLHSGNDLKYRGFGVPGEIDKVLNCSPHLATLIFESELVPGFEFERWPFPLPDCLIEENKFRGEVIITLAYNPPLEQGFGAEYCRSNVEVSLGTYHEDDEGKRHHHREVPPEPKDKSMMYEKDLLEYGFKWSPVKVYRRSIPRGISASDWRLLVKVTHRDGYIPSEPQQFAILITIRDKAEEHPVYNDVINKMSSLGWASNDLRTKTQVRLRP